MGAVIPFCDAPAHACMENAVGNFPNAPILIEPHHGNPAVMVAPHKQIPVFLVHVYVAPAHAANPFIIDKLQIPVWQDFKRSNPFVGDGIQKFPICRNGQVGWVINGYHLALLHTPFFHIHIKNVDAYAVPVGIRPHVRYIFFFTHLTAPPFPVCAEYQILPTAALNLYITLVWDGVLTPSRCRFRPGFSLLPPECSTHLVSLPQ